MAYNPLTGQYDPTYNPGYQPQSIAGLSQYSAMGTPLPQQSGTAPFAMPTASGSLAAQGMNPNLVTGSVSPTGSIAANAQPTTQPVTTDPAVTPAGGGGLSAAGWGNVLGGIGLGVNTLGAIANYNQAQQQWDDTAGLREAQLTGLTTQTEGLAQQIANRKENRDIARGLA